MNGKWRKLSWRHLVSLLVVTTIMLFSCSPPTPTPSPTPTATLTPTAAPQEVVLTMRAWRSSTERINRLLDKFHELHPHTSIKFEPMLPAEYDEVLEIELAAGTAPDLFYLRSFSKSRALYEQGYLEPLGDLAGLQESFDAATLVPWSTEDGIPYGVPFIASSHGVYYNQDIFEALDLGVPETWEAFLATAQTIRDAGVMPFANASRDPWTIAEIVFMNLAPNFIGGREGRLAYLNGERCFNDERMVSAFQAIADLAPYFPEEHELLGYLDSLQLFIQGKAAMWMSGSWDIPDFESAAPDFAWSIFAVPPPAGQPAYVTFHLDVGIGLNAASLRKTEAREFLSWMTTPEFGTLLGNEIPGFFPMHRETLTLNNAHANTFLALNQGRGTDIRFVWEKLRDGTPDAYILVQDGALAVLRGEQSPQAAADALQAGLAQWYPPAQTCGE